MNRVLIHLCPCRRAHRFIEAAEAVGESIQGIVGEGIIEWCIPCASEIEDNGATVGVYVRGECFDLDGLDTAREEIAERLVALSAKLQAAATALQGVA